MGNICIVLYEGLGQQIADGVMSRLKEGFVWIGNNILKSLGMGFIELTPFFAGAAIIGVYLTISGNKKLGTKISSGAIVIYLLLKVILNA